MDPKDRPVVRVGPDRSREYTEQEERRLAENLEAIATYVAAAKYSDRSLAVVLIQEIHATLFHGVRSHAGRPRGPDFGTEVLTFGPNTSLHRNEVPAAVDEAFSKAVPFIRELEENPDDAEYERKALEIAIWLHAEIIRIHPFEDGNGRTCRALLDAILVRLGLRPIPAEFPKQEYRECLNYFYETADMQPLVDLYIGRYGSMLEGEGES